MPVASAQVKSAILLAGLFTKGTTKVTEPIGTRDHTERILKLFKADIKVKQNKIVIKGGNKLFSPGRIYVPGDISSASFFIALASILPDSEILIKNISLNPSRTGIVRVLGRMGADIRVHSSRLTVHCSGEPMGDLQVYTSKLKGTVIKHKETPSLIDELPVLMVAACFASGRTVFEGVSELRIKETDRIKSMSRNLVKMGANIAVSTSGRSEKIIIDGVKELKGARVRSFGDHRTAMSLVVAGMAASGKTYIDDISCINKSFPNFLRLIASVRQ
jgi:3-phosphoshikimate 1-carboxyvinyltransferase